MATTTTTTTAHAPGPAPQVPSSPVPPAGPHLPTPTPSLSDNSVRQKDFERFAHFVALGTVVAVPAIMIMPPRKLDLYTFSLATCGFIAGNHLLRERYNKGFIEFLGDRLGIADGYRVSKQPSIYEVPSLPAGGARAEGGVLSALKEVQTRFDLPTERAREVHERILGAEHAVQLRRRGVRYLGEYERELKASGWGYGADMRRMLEVARSSVQEDAEQWGLPDPVAAIGEDDDDEDARRQGGVKGMASKVWYGQEDPRNWKVQRMREEREAMEEGKGYGSMIMEQIWEVWNWDKRKNEDGDWVPKEEVEGKGQ